MDAKDDVEDLLTTTRSDRKKDIDCYVKWIDISALERQKLYDEVFQKDDMLFHLVMIELLPDVERKRVRIEKHLVNELGETSIIPKICSTFHLSVVDNENHIILRKVYSSKEMEDRKEALQAQQLLMKSTKERDRIIGQRNIEEQARIKTQKKLDQQKKKDEQRQIKKEKRRVHEEEQKNNQERKLSKEQEKAENEKKMVEQRKIEYQKKIEEQNLKKQRKDAYYKKIKDERQRLREEKQKKSKERELLDEKKRYKYYKEIDEQRRIKEEKRRLQEAEEQKRIEERKLLKEQKQMEYTKIKEDQKRANKEKRRLHKDEKKRMKEREKIMEQDRIQHIKKLEERRKSFEEKQLLNDKEVSSKNDYKQGKKDKKPKPKIMIVKPGPPIPADNRGYLLLQKIGWNEGERIGVNDNGSVEPLLIVRRTVRNLGLGA